MRSELSDLRLCVIVIRDNIVYILLLFNSMYQNLLAAIHSNCFADKSGGTIRVLINIVLKNQEMQK